MGAFDRTKRTSAVQLPARLQQLNREIMTERTKDFDYVYAVGKGLRVRVCIMRDADHKYYATAQIGKKAFRREGGCPSGAYIMLAVSMNVYVAQLTQAEREKLANAQMTLAD